MASPTPAGGRDKGARRDLLSIGELARQAGLSTRTIRYYEELGILPPPERTAGGTRRYSRDYFFYLEGTRILKQLGFDLEEIAELGRFALTGATASSRTKAILQEKVAQLDHRIRVLKRLYALVSAAASSRADPDAPVPQLLRWISEKSSDEAAAAAGPEENGPDDHPRPRWS
ncbi:MerR family DNA-binding transcriptional regulator [Thermobifida cellulosilytica]|uniref:MerR family DNA-binding transcriptional regulator n=1 Tax=Thermobifida cellulosilytica TaxID=144786 RepID=UPI000837EFA1|nr:MerR family DNA-binding transcriptional regulator [Thermobifida cellulosilytica]